MGVIDFRWSCMMSNKYSLSAMLRLFNSSKKIHSDYITRQFNQHINPRDVQVIFELGSRDCLDAISLARFYKARVVAFECNPEAIKQCRVNVKNEPRVRLVELAVWDETKTISFFPVVASQWSDGTPITDSDGNETVNIGASSCFEARDDYIQRYEQGQISVPAIRLDQFCLEQGEDSIDMLCIDLQGAALQALQGLGRYIDSVRYVIAELEHREMYQGQSMFPEVDAFLKQKGFSLMEEKERDDWFSDYLYVRC